MAYKLMTKISILVVLFAILWDGTKAQTSCTRTLMGLSPCLNYVTGNSSTPSSSCCSQLSNVVTVQPQCLCLLMNGTASSVGMNINQTLALALPVVCNVNTPPVSRCNAANGPTASTDAPESPPDDSSEAPETEPSGFDIPSGTKTTPSENRGNTKRSSNVVVLVVFIASYALSVAPF